VLREIDPLSVVGVAAAAALALFFHQWDRSLTASLKDPGMRTIVLKPPVLPPSVGAFGERHAPKQ
jgi:hypothetical protein